MNDFQMTRLGTLMVPEAGNAMEIEGVLNPAVARCPKGDLYLFPRMVAKGNYSRIGIARVLFDSKGDPSGVERMGIALEPQEDFEFRSPGVGGCEDARISFVEPLGHYVMTYTALTKRGPRIALARSNDLFHWERLGLATFEPFGSIEFEDVDNKDSCIFPVSVPDPTGGCALALLHRPLFPGTRPEQKATSLSASEPDIHLESIWMSYRDMSVKVSEPYHLCHFTSHHRLAAPVEPWEKLKIGIGAPPVLTRHGWLVVYHGVCDSSNPEKAGFHLRYSAGVMVLSKDTPSKIVYRSRHPVLSPELAEERIGTIENVVFPTGVDRRDDIGMPDRIDVYYGMADDNIGVATLNVPLSLPGAD